MKQSTAAVKCCRVRNALRIPRTCARSTIHAARGRAVLGTTLHLCHPPTQQNQLLELPAAYTGRPDPHPCRSCCPTAHAKHQPAGAFITPSLSPASGCRHCETALCAGHDWLEFLKRIKAWVAVLGQPSQAVVCVAPWGARTGVLTAGLVGDVSEW